ncbi:peptide-methionine (R)-S-oxide reductase MsrB [Patescibacteria group bacterium]|nr:peptide-methionine (R)-S-oxide reductase MsrB [Patescibacteria group bacterium]
MTYIAILATIIIGAYASFAYFLPQGNDGAVGTDSSGIMDPITAAKEAARQLEGNNSPDTQSMTQNTNNQNDTATMPNTTATMMVAGGCFWCVESDLEKLPGVSAVVSGYAGGTTQNPTYENYGSGGHREVVEVTYDPAVISFEEILIYAMKHMDPTDGEGSFGDRGKYYAPAFYYSNDKEKGIIDNLIKEVNEKGPYDKDLAVAVEATPTFYAAEDYHQDYYKGTLSSLKYKYYRTASGRDTFIAKYWGTDTKATLPWRADNEAGTSREGAASWESYVKPSKEVLRTQLDDVTFKVTQEDGTERAGTSPLDKNYERGIYVDVLSGEPLFSSKDKFDSGTGWPSFVKPISATAVTEHEDNSFFSKRTEIRSAIADNHLGHVFPDGPRDRGGLRYCMNGVSLRFVPESEMKEKGYEQFLGAL